MNIALFGYGKMGQAIERIAVMRGHHIVLKIDAENRAGIHAQSFAGCDLAIEFTHPEAAADNVTLCLEAGIPVISGTTGWSDEFSSVAVRCEQLNGALLVASNFSIGVNLFFELNRQLARLMQPHTEYRIQMEETHHTQKKDAPSGTAITLAQDIIAANAAYTGWQLGTDAAEGNLPIEAHRKEDVPGTHSITYSSGIDDITIEHTAHSREGFAMGAVLAAEFIIGKRGVFSMKDVLASA